MKCKIEIGFGIGFNKCGAPLKLIEQRLNTVTKEALKVFGGYSLTTIEGGWVNGAGEVVIEPGRVLTCYANDTSDKINDLTALNALNLAAFIKDTLNQASVILSVNPCEWGYV